MEEIKFRVWDKTRKVIYRDVKLDHAYYEKQVYGDMFVAIFLNVYPAEYKNFERYEVSNFEILLWTGKKDKNGKEIYEGDLVKHKSGAIGEVVWNNHTSGFYIHKVSKSDTDYNSFEFYLNGERNFEWEDLEVIGNIYEISQGR
jgi:uncharacterized phage protein (TIGR01671 family)